MKATLYLISISALFAGNLVADTIVLKSGVSYEGKVISQDEKSYLIEVHVTKSIKDERRIAKDQVKEIVKESADTQDFDSVKSLTPTPDSLSKEKYAARVATASSFLTKHPKSTHTEAVKAILQTLKKEQLVISEGGFKLDGQLILKSDIESNAYDIDALVIFSKMKKLAKAGDYQPALRQWETIQKSYAHSPSYKDGAELAMQVLKSYSTQLNSLINTLESRVEKRKVSLDRLSQGNRQRTIQMLADNRKKYAALIEKEAKQLRTKWLTIDPENKKALEYNHRNAKSALKSLSSYDASKVKLAGPAYRGAYSSLAEGNLAEAKKHLRELKSLRLSKKYIDPLAKQLEEKQIAAAQAEKKAKEQAAIEKELQKRLAKEAAEKATEENKKKPRGKRNK